MKRIGNLYSKIFDMQNLIEAHKHARRRKTFYSEVKLIDRDPIPYLTKIQDALKNHNYQTSKYTIFDKFDSGKVRTIYKLPYYPDRIVHWAIMQVIEPYIVSTFTINTCASIPGRGIHKAFDLEDHYLKSDPEGTKYCLKMDIRKFFPSVDHEVLITLLKKKFKDKELLELLEGIIHSVPSGLPIGNYLSQYLANFYLAYFDHWLKEEKKVKYYVRYMDDMVIFMDNKEDLHKLLREIKEYLRVNLKLELKSNWQVFPVAARGVDFLGYRHFGYLVRLRRSTALKIRRKYNKIKKKSHLSSHDYGAINSYQGWSSFCSSRGLLRTYIDPLGEMIAEYERRHHIRTRRSRHAKTNRGS